MTGWVLWLAVVTVLSYLADTGLLPLLQDVRVPVLGASVLSILLLLTTMGLLNRMQGKKKAGERETLVSKVQALERELADARRKAP